MSGITGLVYADGGQQADTATQLERMDSAIAHRGDNHQTHTLEAVGGFTLRYREHGAFVSESYGSDLLTIVLDGNITNKAELIKAEKLAAATTSAELIAHLFTRYAIDAFRQLDGPFAIVIYQKDSGRLVIARDLFAGRPIFFSIQDNTFFFASEAKGILAYKGFRRGINRRMIPHSLIYGLTSGPETLFNDIYKVMPGYVYEGDISSGLKARFMLVQQPYKKIDRPMAEYAEEIWDLLGKNTNRLKGSSKSAGLFLSGGVDSSLVALKQAEAGFEPSLAISCGYTDSGAEDKDESEIARQTAADFGLEFKTVNVSSEDDILGTIRNIIYKMDEPSRFAISIPIEKSLTATKGSFDCLLTGMFADVLYGTEEHYDSPLYGANKKLPAPLRWSIKSILGLCKILGIPKLSGWANMYNRVNVASMKEYIARESKHNADLYNLVDMDTAPEWAPEIQRIYDNITFKYPEDEWTLIGTTLFVYCWNELFEILASHAQCDTVHPFLSNEAYALSLEMPYKYKMAKAYTKPCLRELAAKKISPELAYMQKKMFQSPATIWLINSKQLRDYVFGLKSPDAKVKKIMNPSSVDACIDSYRHQLEQGSLDEPLSRILYSILGYEIWLERFFDEEFP